MLEFRQRTSAADVEARPKSTAFHITNNDEASNKEQLSIECPEFNFDFNFEFSEPVSPRLDLDTAPRSRKNRQGIRFKGARIETALDSLHSPRLSHFQPAPGAPPTPTSPSRGFLGTCLGAPSSPKKLYSPTFFKKCFQSKSFIPERTCSEDGTRFSLPVFTTKSGGVKFQRSQSELPNEPNNKHSARPQPNDEETEKLLYGFHVRKSCTALASNDFDDLLFKQDVPTLKLSLTPDWLDNTNNL